MLIDVHSHCHGREHFGRYAEPRRRVYGDAWGENTPGRFDEAMKPVDVALVFGMRATRMGVDTPLSYVVDFCAKASTATIGFMALDLCDDDVMDQLEAGLEAGMRGVKLYPTLAGFDPREAKHDRFFHEVARQGVPLVIHTGTSPAPQAILELSHPFVYDELGRRHPDVRMVLAHMSHPWQRECIVVLRKQPNIYADVSASWVRTLDGYHALVRAQDWGVTEKLLFGSDYPIWTPQEGIDGLRELAAHDWSPLPRIERETVEGILNRNALDILGLSMNEH